MCVCVCACVRACACVCVCVSSFSEKSMTDDRMMIISLFLIFVEPACVDRDIIVTTSVRCMCVRFACLRCACDRPKFSGL